MIPRLTAQKIVEHLRDGALTHRTIAGLCGVSHHTVDRFAGILHVIRSLPPEQVQRIRTALNFGLTCNAIAHKERLPRMAVQMIKSRHDVRALKAFEKLLCPTCGHLVNGSENRNQQLTLPRQDDLAYMLSADRIKKLQKVARDIVELHNLHLIPNQLFHHLAIDAQEALE